MQEKLENFLLEQLTKKLDVLVIQSDEAISSSFDEYFVDIFNSVEYYNLPNDIVGYFKIKKPDIVFIDLQTKGIKPFELITELFEISSRQVFIAISSIKSEEILKKSIKHRVFDFLDKPLNLSILKDSIVHSLDYIILNNPDKINSDVSRSKIDISPKDAIVNLMENYKVNIELVNHYKGIPIMKNAVVLDIVDNSVLVKIENIQKYALQNSHHAIISSHFLSNDIYANLKKIDLEKGIAVFDNLSFINSYVHHRKNTRVSPNKSFNMLYELDGVKHSCNTIDISSQYVLISMDKLPDKFKLSSQVELYFSFKLPSTATMTKTIVHTISTSSIIHDVFELNDVVKVLFYFDLIKEKKKILEEYIYKRSLELIREYKKELTVINNRKKK